MNNTIKISCEFPEVFAKIVAQLMREGIRFDASDSGAYLIIELKGY
jgi:hypothetical protein